MSEIKTIKMDNFEMDYFSFGNGDKSFVIVPGMSLKSVMLSADAIEMAYAPFKEEYTVYCFDYAKNPRRGYSVSDMADDLALAMCILGIENAYLFGASLGGMVIQYLDIRHPGLVSKMVLASSTSRLNDSGRANMERWKKYVEDGDVRSLNVDLREHIYGEEYLKQWHDAFVSIENDGTEEELQRLGIFIDACIGLNSYGDLDKITCPVLVIGSYDDKALLGQDSIEMAEKIGCELYMYKGFGHAVYDEAPDYKERLLNFYRD